MGVDRHGNAAGAEGELGLDGGFRGSTIAVIQLYRFDFANARSAMTDHGFEVCHWNTVPALAELEEVLARANQLWVISTTSTPFSQAHINAMVAFFARGRSLYLWGDNDVCSKAVNPIIAAVMPGVQLDEVNQFNGQNYVSPRATPGTGSGFDAHPIFTGIQRLYEGWTIARFLGANPRLKYIMSSSEPNPALAICDDNLNGCGRLAIDVAFTRLYCSWDDAGTSKFVKNVAAWLYGLDSDWM